MKHLETCKPLSSAVLPPASVWAPLSCSGRARVLSEVPPLTLGLEVGTGSWLSRIQSQQILASPSSQGGRAPRGVSAAPKPGHALSWGNLLGSFCCHVHQNPHNCPLAQVPLPSPTVSIWGLVGTPCHTLSSVLSRSLGFGSLVDSPPLWGNCGKLPTTTYYSLWNFLSSLILKIPPKPELRHRQPELWADSLPGQWHRRRSPRHSTWACFTRAASLNTKS